MVGKEGLSLHRCDVRVRGDEREKDVKFLCCWILAFENLETFMRCVVISQSEEDNHLSFCEHKK